MKCEFCAADISIEDKRCPHCDAENKYYKAHRAEMDEYQKRFEATKAYVERKTSKYTRRSFAIAAIAVLVMLNVIAILVLVNIREINYDIQYKRNTKNAPAIAKKMAELEENEEFFLLAGLNSNLNMKTYKTEVAEYGYVNSFASDYKNLFNTINAIVLGGNKSYTNTDMAKNINRNIDSMYENRFERYETHKDHDYFAPRHIEAMDKMLEDSKRLLKVYLKFNQEELDNLFVYTSSERQLLLERKIGEVRGNG